MANSSLSSLTVAFSSSLSFSSSVSSKPSTLSFPWVRIPRAASARRLNQIVAASSSLTTVGAVAGSSFVAEEEVEGVSLEKYVKSRLPGGFAAQRIIGTGRRKCAIARVVLQEGTGKFVINYRDAQHNKTQSTTAQLIPLDDLLVFMESAYYLQQFWLQTSYRFH